MHTRPLACLPNAKGAMLGELGHFSAKMGKDESWDSIVDVCRGSSMTVEDRR